MAEIGFRIVGMRCCVYDTEETTGRDAGVRTGTGSEAGICKVVTYDKAYGMRLPPERAHEGFAAFFHNGRGLRKEVLTQMCAKLRGLVACFEKQEQYQFYSSSLLFVYDGDQDHGKGDAIQLKLIDFGHVQYRRQRDDGFLFGCRNALAILEALAVP